MRIPLLTTMLLAACLGAATVVGAQSAPPPAAAPAPAPAPADEAKEGSTPVFTSILKEGARVVPTPQEQYQAELEVYEAKKAEHEKAATESVRAAADNLRRIGLFASETILALMIAGAIGAAFAFALAALKRRRERD